MHLITMTLLSGPGRAMGDENRRIRLELGLDPLGTPDTRAWLDDPDPWRAHLEAPDSPNRRGDIQYDADFGWHLRMAEGENSLDDASMWTINFPSAPTRPGEVVTTRGPDGDDWAWRIVSVERKANGA